MRGRCFGGRGDGAAGDDPDAGHGLDQAVEGVDIAGGDAVDEVLVLGEGLGKVGFVGVVHRLIHGSIHPSWVVRLATRQLG
jgi:hypothetical protein